MKLLREVQPQSNASKQFLLLLLVSSKNVEHDKLTLTEPLTV